jgi:hypothetical protein
VRLISLIATVRAVMRLPIRHLRDLWHILHGVQVSNGEIVAVLHRLVTHAHPLLTSWKTTIRASPAVQADETGWREDGLNGSIWSVCTPMVRSYEYHHSRAGEVVRELSGEECQAVPQQTLCKRSESVLPELFTFVAIAGVPAHNKLAERRVRPLVSAGKISGGSRSPKGSATRMGLASLFGTWAAQGLTPFHQGLALLTQPNLAGQVVPLS